MNRIFDRAIPKDWKHVEKYPLRLAAAPSTIIPAPVTMGVNWYSSFDEPVKDKDGKYWIGKNHKNLGYLRGGHCLCIPQDTKKDLVSWYKYYDQGEEGACVGFGASRMMTIQNRKMYNPWWLWNEAKIVDGFPETNPGDQEGTTVDAAMQVLSAQGHIGKRAKKPNIKDGIAEYRWATNIDDLFSVLQNEEYKKLGALPHLNSWGKNYPHIVWMPCETHDVLLRSEGEYSMIIDRY